ncbi:hypothetical protein U1Q18_012530 [Sarracenia purpurea var. burkii]
MHIYVYHEVHEIIAYLTDSSPKGKENKGKSNEEKRASNMMSWFDLLSMSIQFICLTSMAFFFLKNFFSQLVGDNLQYCDNVINWLSGVQLRESRPVWDKRIKFGLLLSFFFF